MYKLDGVVIVYNPTIKIISNIKTYIKYLKKLYIIDNSKNNNSDIFKDIQKSEYIWNKQNLGISVSLNIAVNLAKQNNSIFLLTMDQDSYFDSDTIKNMIKELNTNNSVAIYAPSYNMNNYCNQNNQIVMTSGNIINIAICEKLGGFNNDFFIDCVDHEYCLKALSNNYEIKIIKETILHHELGNIKVHNIGIKKIMTTNHVSWRRYFITRNRLYINDMYKKKFPLFCKKELRNNKREMIKILLFEKNKFKKFYYIFMGKRDYKRNIKGVPNILKEVI